VANKSRYLRGITVQCRG